MGYFSNLAIEIEEALFQGATVEQIAERFNLSVPAVMAYIEQLEEVDREPLAWDWPMWNPLTQNIVWQLHTKDLRRDMSAWTNDRLRDFE